MRAFSQAYAVTSQEFPAHQDACWFHIAFFLQNFFDIYYGVFVSLLVQPK